jgi:hypothetical protein
VAHVLSFVDNLKLLIRKAQYRLWKRRNQSASFKDYFAELAQKNIQSGRTHPTLGDNLAGEKFGVSGHQTFMLLTRRYGIQPGDICVDYGCGTLRVGVHAIEYLDPGCYWGLDISDFLLNEGRKLIGPSLEHSKAPNLRVISESSLREAVAAHPKLVFSISVLVHVHPEELSEYFTNIVSLIDGNGVGVVTTEWTEGETYQTARQSWVHSATTLRNAAPGNLTFIERARRSNRTSGVIEVHPSAK